MPPTRPLRPAAGLLLVAVFAAGFSCEKAARLPAFDESRAFRDLEAQVAMGPRVPGTEPHRRALAHFERALREAGGTVTIQALPDTAFPIDGVDTLYNVRARFGPAGGAPIVLGAHWDSRPAADRETDAAARAQAVPGANDGASGVAVLLEVARVLGAAPPPVAVEIVLFDGEDAGRHDREESFCRGSQGYVRTLGHPRPLHAIIVDMVGRRGVQIHPEVNSTSAAPNLVERLWEGAGKVRAPAFVDGARHQVYDDHVPFIQAGIPAVDLIDLDDPHWHTLQDLPEHCDPTSLGQVGRVLLWHLYTLEVE